MKHLKWFYKKISSITPKNTNPPPPQKKTTFWCFFMCFLGVFFFRFFWLIFFTANPIGIINNVMFNLGARVFYDYVCPSLNQLQRSIFLRRFYLEDMASSYIAKK